jgi:tetratricopeptide (TPR) repeat protein
MHINEYTQRGLERLAPLYENAGNHAEAQRAYGQLSDIATSAPVAANALKGYLRNAVAQSDREKSMSAATRVLESRFLDNETAVAAKFILAGGLDAMGRRDEAMRLYAEIASETQTAEGAEASYILIKNAFDRGDNTAAEKMIFEFADRNTPHSYWLGSSFLVLGDIYAGMGDTFQARATFQSIIDGYSPANDGIVAAARERIARLGN